MAETARIFIGFDSKEVVAYHVLAQSIIEHASTPVAFSPIVLSHLQGLFTRERNALQSTEFSFSRFMVPYLSGYEGWSLFVDCDMLARADIAELWALRDERFAVCASSTIISPRPRPSSSARRRPNTRRRTGRASCCSTIGAAAR